MTVEELKELLELSTDGELAAAFHRGVSSVSNWRTQGHVPQTIELKAHKLKESIGAFQGSNNHIAIGGATHTSPEAQMVHDMTMKWSEQKRKKLLRVAHGPNATPFKPFALLAQLDRATAF